MNREVYFSLLKDAGFPSEKPSMEDLWRECTKLSDLGDFHLEAVHGGAVAGSCETDMSMWHGATDVMEALAKYWYFHPKGGNGYCPRS